MTELENIEEANATLNQKLAEEREAHKATLAQLHALEKSSQAGGAGKKAKAKSADADKDSDSKSKDVMTASRSEQDDEGTKSTAKDDDDDDDEDDDDEEEAEKTDNAEADPETSGSGSRKSSPGIDKIEKIKRRSRDKPTKRSSSSSHLQTTKGAEDDEMRKVRSSRGSAHGARDRLFASMPDQPAGATANAGASSSRKSIRRVSGNTHASPAHSRGSSPPRRGGRGRTRTVGGPEDAPNLAELRMSNSEPDLAVSGAAAPACVLVSHFARLQLDLDDPRELKRTVAFLSHQLLAVRDLVNETLDAQASAFAGHHGTRSSAPTPRGSRTRRSHHSASGSSSAAMSRASSSLQSVDSKHAMSALRGKLEEQMNLQKTRARKAERTKDGDARAAPVPPLLKKEASIARLDQAPKAANAPSASVKESRERHFAMPDAVSAMCQYKGHVWIGCENGALVVYDAAARTRVDELYASVAFDHNGGPDKLLGASTAPAAIAAINATIEAGPDAAGRRELRAVPVVAMVTVRSTIWVSFRDGTLVVFDAETRAQQHVFDDVPRVTRLVNVGDQHVWGITMDMKILVWRVRSLKLVKRVQRNHFCVSCTTVNDTVWLGTESKIIRFSAKKRHAIDSLAGHDKFVQVRRFCFIFVCMIFDSFVFVFFFFLFVCFFFFLFVIHFLTNENDNIGTVYCSRRRHCLVIFVGRQNQHLEC